jgi:hypothetical protein
MEIFGALMGLGGVLKHLIPSQKVNKFIPYINFGAATAYGVLTGKDPATAAMEGFQAATMATGTHQAAKILIPDKVKVNGQRL